MGWHNILSKTDRALAAYIISKGAGTAADTFPLRSSLQMQTVPVTICHATRGTQISPFAADYEVSAVIEVRNPGAVDVGQNAQAPRLAGDARVQATFDLFFTHIDSSAERLAADITAAANTLAVGDPNNADLADFTVFGLTIGAVECGIEEEGDVWIDRINLTLSVAPSAIA
jgi:hypothetical protein